LQPPQSNDAMVKVANPVKSRRWRCRCRSSTFLVVSVVLLVIYSVFRLHRFGFVEREAIAMASVQTITTRASNNNDGDWNLSLSFISGGISVHRETIEGRDVLWASPRDNPQSSSSSSNNIDGENENESRVKGLLFLAHGCGHSNLDWFSRKSPECEDCLGLPEESAIVEMALDLGLVVIAMSSSNWNTKCWSGFDITPVALVLNELWHRFSSAEDVPPPHPARLPLYAFGASSGGAFVSSLASPLQSRFGIRLDGFVSQIAAQLPLLKEDEKDVSHDLSKVYVTMNRDGRTDKAAQARVKKCQSSSTTKSDSSSQESNSSRNRNSNNNTNNRCKHIRLPPRRIVPSYFANRIRGVSQAESEEMAKVLTEAGILGTDNGELIEDPRQSHKQWSDALWSASASASSSSSLLAFQKRGDSLIPDRSPISEVLNVAWGFHEMSRDGVREALEFCVARQSTE
jgi:hypothetical protein